MAVNNPAERSFGAIIAQLQRFGHIGLHNTGDVSQVQVNGDLSQGYNNSGRKIKKKEQVKGIFHMLPKEMVDSLLKMCIEDAPHLCAVDYISLTKQHTAKRTKGGLMYQKRLEAATEAYIDALYCFDMPF
eukprot:15335991-Ditylum_brightwellii.AAC.1